MSDHSHDDLIIDTSRMNEGKRQAMEVAEEARSDAAEERSFADKLFMGELDLSLMAPFPEQSAEDRQEGDAIVERVRTFLLNHLNPDEVDETRTIPDDVVKGLAELGVFALKVPKKYNGLGLSQVNYNRVMSMIAAYCGSTAVLISAHQSIGVPQPLKIFGSEEQKQRYMPRFREGAISAFALTEEYVGSDPARLSTEAKLSEDGSCYILNGRKLWCTNGLIADVMVVMAQTEPKVVRGKERKQISAFIVEKNMPGIKYTHRCDFMGIRGIQNGLIEFDQVRVPKENLLWEEGKGLKLALTTLNTGRLTLPAACAGMAKQCLGIMREWGRDREQWGAPIGEHEFGQDKIAYTAATTLAMEAVTWLTSHWADDGDKDIRIEAAMAKYFCSEAAWTIVDLTMQFRGGRGYEKSSSLRERGEAAYPVERMMRDCRINRIIEGTSEVMTLFLAREAMDTHLQMAAPLIKPGVSIFKKLKAGVSLLTYYAKWYPKQWVNGSLWSKYDEFGELSPYINYVERSAHRLARTMFHCMARYRDRLEQRQLILADLMNVGTELFAMTATCSYARMLLSNNPMDSSPLDLAKLFCLQAQDRIEKSFRAIKDHHLPLVAQISKDVLSDQMTWLEEGGVPLQSKS